MEGGGWRGGGRGALCILTAALEPRLFDSEASGGEQLVHADDAVQVRAHHERDVTQPVGVRTCAVSVGPQ